jgi:hypothetical protein
VVQSFSLINLDIQLNVYSFIIYFSTLPNFGTIVKHELKRMRKEIIVAQFDALSLDSPGWNEEIPKISQDGWYPGRDLNPGSPEYEAEILHASRRHMERSRGLYVTVL